MTDSYHFESVPKFRVGGVYRQQNGVVVRLEGRADNATAQAVRCESNPKGYKNSGGARRLSDGRYVFQAANDYYECHLVPDELTLRDGQWVAADAPIVFPSGAAVLTSGDKIVGRVGGTFTGVVVTVGAGGSGGTADRLQGALDSLAKKCEPIRPALDWNTATPFDPFGPDFIVTKGEVPTAPLHTSPTTDSAYPAIAGLLRG